MHVRILRTHPRTAIALAVAVLLAGLLWSLLPARSTVTQAKFDQVHIGESESDVKNRLGTPNTGPSVIPTGEQCLWWLMPNGGLQSNPNWMVYFRDGKVTSKSTHN
jgi:hypothetical protein